jgi:NAD-dependent oxidoreductase involved in siderophore biosynthesis
MPRRPQDIQLTEFGESLLVAFAADNLVFLGLGLVGNLLEGSEPAVALALASGLELVLVAVELEGDLLSA